MYPKTCPLLKCLLTPPSCSDRGGGVWKLPSDQSQSSCEWRLLNAGVKKRFVLKVIFYRNTQKRALQNRASRCAHNLTLYAKFLKYYWIQISLSLSSQKKNEEVLRVVSWSPFYRGRQSIHVIFLSIWNHVRKRLYNLMVKCIKNYICSNMYSIWHY